MLCVGTIARGPVLKGVFDIVQVSASLDDSTNDVNSIVLLTDTQDDDWILHVAAVRWDTAMLFPYYGSSQLGTFGNTATGIQLRGAVVPYRYGPDMHSATQLRQEAPGIVSGLFQALMNVRGASKTAGVVSSSSKHGTAGLPTFNSVSTSAGDMVVACTFYSSLLNPNNLGAGWTRAFYDESSFGDDCLFVVDYRISTEGSVTPPSVRSTNLPSGTAWVCVAVVIPPA